MGALSAISQRGKDGFIDEFSSTILVNLLSPEVDKGIQDMKVAFLLLYVMMMNRIYKRLAIVSDPQTPPSFEGFGAPGRRRIIGQRSEKAGRP